MKRALILVDLQNDFITEGGALATPECIDCGERIYNYVRSLSPDGFSWIFATQDTHREEDYGDTLEGKLIPKKHCISGTWGHELKYPISGATLVKKDTFGYIDWALPGDVEEVVIMGVCTSICVLANATVLRAKFPNLRIVVPSMYCADITQEAHQAALICLKSQQCEVV